MPTLECDLAIAGAGILGLAHAWAAAKRGLRVAVFERSAQAAGASVRNFGMIWPIGQPAGKQHDLAMTSRRLWLEVLETARLPRNETGSLHLTYEADEEAVAREFAETAPGLGYDCSWKTPAEVLELSPAAQPAGLRGALWSASEFTVDPRSVICRLPQYLAEAYGVRFHFGTAMRAVEGTTVVAGADTWRADATIVCGGDDFESLFPHEFQGSGITRCKLQMLRTAPQPAGWRLGPSLAAGLSLRFYHSFRLCTTLPALSARISAEMPEYERWQIHVMASATGDGAITLGDSHEYGLAVDAFNKSEIDELILDYAAGFLRLPEWAIAQRWHGVYAKHPEKPVVRLAPAANVRIVTAPGGAGMTLSFGIAEETLHEMRGKVG